VQFRAYIVRQRDIIRSTPVFCCNLTKNKITI
jgi:hypothetical protein